MEAVVNLERLADGTLLSAGTHRARRDPVGLSSLNVDAADRAADTLLPVVDVDTRKRVARHAGVQERVRDVESRALNRGDLVKADNVRARNYNVQRIQI